MIYDEIKGYEHSIEEYKQNIGSLQTENMSLKEEAIKLRARSEELERHNETLKKELEISQETHRNYMMQMQTLINQKAIEAPGAKKPWWRFW
jgi:FtsZ-binding cell division protein ZapB